MKPVTNEEKTDEQKQIEAERYVDLMEDLIKIRDREYREQQVYNEAVFWRNLDLYDPKK